MVGTLLSRASGTNDLTGFEDMEPDLGKDKMEKQGAPQMPSEPFYLQNMAKILDRLENELQAEIAVLTLPLLGEDLHARQNKRLFRLNNALISAVRGRKGRRIEILDLCTRLCVAVQGLRDGSWSAVSSRLMIELRNLSFSFLRTYPVPTSRRPLTKLREGGGSFRLRGTTSWLHSCPGISWVGCRVFT